MNFRIDDSLREKIDNLKQYVFPQKSMSDIARQLLEEGVSDWEAKDLNVEPDVRVIARRIELNKLVNYNEIFFLIENAYEAYTNNENFIDFFSLELIIDILKAFRDLTDEINLDHIDATHFLIKLKKIAPSTKATHRELRAYINDAISEIEQGINLEKHRQLAERYCKNLYLIIRDEAKLTNECSLYYLLRNYLATIAILAKYNIYNKTNIIQHHYTDRKNFAVSAFKENKNKSNKISNEYLEIVCELDVYLKTSIVFKLFKNKISLMLDYPELNELMKLLILFFDNPSNALSEYFGRYFSITIKNSETSNPITLSYKNIMTITLSVEETTELKNMLCEMFFSLENGLNKVRIEWGGI